VGPADDVAETDDSDAAADDSHSEKGSEEGQRDESPPRGPVVVVDSLSTQVKKQDVPASTVGSALRRNADGSVAKARIVRKKGKGIRVCRFPPFVLSEIVT
jgi:hypothetical protein